MYISKNYEGHEVLATLNADEKESFETVNALSNNFTEQDEAALALDAVIGAIIKEKVAQNESPKVRPVSKPARKSPASIRKGTGQAQGDSFDEIVQGLAELYEALAKEKGITGQVGLENLSPELQALVQSGTGTQTIKYELPKQKIPAKSVPKPDIPEWQTIVDDVVMGNPVLLIGGAGTGKTTLAENVAKALGRKHITINCSQWTAPTEIIGGQTLEGYQEGKMIEAWSKGMLLILDELPKLDPNTAGLLNEALAKTKVADTQIFNGRKEAFKKHEGFAAIATGNVYPNAESNAYGANFKQDLSLLDRFSGSVYFIEKNVKLEKKLVGFDWLWAFCDAIRTAIEEQKYEAQMSLRFMLNARDAYLLEMHRIKEKGKNGVMADEGKTLKEAVDSYLSTFTQNQQEVLKDKSGYDALFGSYQYRKKEEGRSELSGLGGFEVRD